MLPDKGRALLQLLALVTVLMMAIGFLLPLFVALVLRPKVIDRDSIDDDIFC